MAKQTGKRLEQASRRLATGSARVAKPSARPARPDGPVRPRSVARQQRTRRDLLASAYAVISAEGVERAGLQTITETADVAIGTFYNYFPSKEAIAAAVLDCVIDNLARRNDAALASAGVDDPVVKIALSCGCSLREMMDNPLWFWWLKRPDLLVERMRPGFRRVALRDLGDALALGRLQLAGSAEAAWSLILWQLIGGARDIVERGAAEAGTSQRIVVANILQGLGVAPAEAAGLAARPLPIYAPLPIDFGFIAEPG